MTAHGLADLAPPGAAVSALAVDADGGVVAERSPDRAVAPASNTKLVTAALALAELGPGFRFETVVRADGDVDAEGATLDGDLRLVGSGAPDLDAAALDSLAADVSDRVARVTGDLVLDTSLFDGAQYGPGRTWRDTHRAYGAPTAALSLARNTVTVALEPTGDGVSVALDPETAAVEPVVDVSLAPDAAADGSDVTVRADSPDGLVRVEGTVPPGERVELAAPVRRPVEHVGAAARDALAAAGVAVEGDVVVVDGDDPPAGRDGRLAAVRSAPLRDLVREMNVPSDNVVADTLARATAAHATGEGSWEAWRDLVAERFDALGVGTVRVRDGSGLSRYNRLPARGVVALLRRAADSDWGGAFFDSLPAPGEGTLADRLDGVPVAAKTGTLTGARALSGRVAGPDGPVYFSLLVGDVTVEAETVRDRQDDVVRSLAGDGE